MKLGEVKTFPHVEADKAQALKPLEEAAEVYAAWQVWDKWDANAEFCELTERQKADMVERARRDALHEIADCVTACCNLAAAMGCEDLRPYLQMAEHRNEERGRYE